MILINTTNLRLVKLQPKLQARLNMPNKRELNKQQHKMSSLDRTPK